nr:YjjG family noncanonical pyrimidine nucleotidase [Bacteroides pyogenes]
MDSRCADASEFAHRLFYLFIIYVRYKNIFFDLDDTIWAFSKNARDTFEEVYCANHFDRFFDSFDHFYTLYEQKNVELWSEYGEGKISKDELNSMRFFYPLQSVGIHDEALAKRYSADFFSIIPTKSGLMPHAKEVLEYLAPRYNLYILSNGFRELQWRKMCASGVDGYFKKLILSEDLGVMKPWPEIFHFALSATQSGLRDSLMIGDSWEADITGAKGVGMHQVFYNVTGRTEFPFHPTYHIRSLKDLINLL